MCPQIMDRVQNLFLLSFAALIVIALPSYKIPLHFLSLSLSPSSNCVPAYIQIFPLYLRFSYLAIFPSTPAIDLGDMEPGVVHLEFCV